MVSVSADNGSSIPSSNPDLNITIFSASSFLQDVMEPGRNLESLFTILFHIIHALYILF